MKINQRKAGVFLSYLSQGIHMLSGLLYTPLMLRLLGQSEYGLYQLVYSVVSYLGLLSMGFGSSYVRFYSRYRAKKDEIGIAKLNGMFMIIFLVISLICAICGIVMISNIEFVFASGLKTEEIPIARWLMSFMVFNLCVTFPSSVFDCSITAHEQFFFQKLIGFLQALLNPFFTLPLLLMGYGSIAMVSVTTFLTIAKLIANLFFCLKKIKMKFRLKGVQLSLLKEMWTFTFYIFLNLIVDQINWSIDKFLLGRLAGTIVVAVYGVASQLNTMYLQLSTALSSVFIPKVNRVVAEKDDNRELTKLFTRVGRIQLIILAFVMFGYLFFGREFIKFWAGNGYENSYETGILLMLPVTIPLIQNLGIEIQRAKNKHKVRSLVYLFIAIGNIAISIPCIKRWGAQGAAFGTALSLTLGNILFMNIYYHKAIGLDMIYFWKEILRFFPTFFLIALGGLFWKIALPMEHGLLWMGSGIVFYTFIYAVSMWFFGMNIEEKQMLYGPWQKRKNRLRR